MGSGKGNPEFWVAVVKPGRILFEMGGEDITEEIAKEAMRLAQYKLPVKTKFISIDKNLENSPKKIQKILKNLKRRLNNEKLRVFKEFKKLNSEQITEKIDQLRKDLFDLRFKQATKTA